jgi:hypothetical protein
MKKETFKFKKGQTYYVDETSYIFSGFGRCFKNIGLNGEDDDLGDNQICLRSCEIIIKLEDLEG